MKSTDEEQPIFKCIDIHERWKKAADEFEDYLLTNEIIPTCKEFKKVQNLLFAACLFKKYDLKVKLEENGGEK